MPLHCILLMFAVFSGIAGLAGHAAPSVDAPQRSSDGSAPAADRDAILAMAGAFRITFNFEETVAIAPDYRVTEPYTEHATELVQVIADEGDYISLQHVLVVETSGGEPIIVKHWRQDWRYEDTDVLSFKGHATWQREPRDAAEVRGTWTQAVFQTTDAPRYEAVGRWTHIGDQSSWESELTWRPLPRRERRRTDYNVILCRNRHTITPTGWVHEQDNQKLALTPEGAPQRIVAHEIGINTYERTDAGEVSAAVSYWAAHSSAWAAVRAAWSPILERQRFSIRQRAHGTRLNSLIDAAIDDSATRDALPDQLMAFIAD